MLRKIYQELVLIRKELQAIRNYLEQNNSIETTIEKINEVTKGTGKSPLLL